MAYAVLNQPPDAFCMGTEGYGEHSMHTNSRPLTRYVEDLSTIMEIISGPDFRDAGVIPAVLGDPISVPLTEL